MVQGRYLATFSNNCFAISRNQVAAMVAAAVLVATSGHRLNRNRTHFTYDLLQGDHEGRADRLFHPRGDTARVSTRVPLPWQFVPERKKRSSFFARHTSASTQNDPAERDCARDPFSTGAALLSCQRTKYKPFTPGGSAGVGAHPD